MSEQAGTGAAGVVVGAAGAGAPTGGQAGGTGAAPGVGSGGAAPSGASDWTTGLNEELRGFVQNKGFKDPSQVLDSYRNLEKHLGVPADQIIRMPKEGDAEGYAKLFDKLGRPKSADEYGFSAAKEGGDENFVKWAKGTFHELGLSKTQGEKLVSKWGEYAQGAQKQHAESIRQKSAQEAEGLKAEWGQAYEQNLSVVDRAAEAFGLDKKVLAALRDTMGSAKALKLLHTIGSKLGEGEFVNGGKGGSSGFGIRSPEAARARISELRADPGFVKRYTSGDVNARQEMSQLHQQAYG